MNLLQHPRYKAEGPWESRVDDGFAEYLYAIYRYMTCGLLFSGAVAYLCARSPLYSELATRPVIAVPTLLLPLVYVGVVSHRIERISPRQARGYFWLFALLIGFSTAGISQIYWDEGIAHAFFETAGAFLLLSLVGFWVKRSLTAMGTFIMLALVGIGLAVTMNGWQPEAELPLLTTTLGIVLFAALTACNMPTLKHRFYWMRMTGVADDPSPSIGALNLYLDFINLFAALLRHKPNQE